MPLVVGEIVQVSYRSLWENQRILLVTNWRVTSTTSVNDLLGDLNSVIAAFKSVAAGTPMSAYRPCLGTNVTVKGVRAQVVRPSRSLYMEDAVDLVGTGPNAAEAGNVAGVVTRVSNAAGRKGISTSHLGPLPEGHFTAGLITGAAIVIHEAFASRFISDVSAGAGTITLAPVILHPAGSAPVYSNIVTFRTGLQVRTMRRRTVGLGE